MKIKALAIILLGLSCFQISKAQELAPPVLLETLEYYIDTDPGMGNGTKIVLNALETTVDSDNIEIDISNLSYGFHKLVTRFKDKDGQWGIPKLLVFYVPEPRQETMIENAEIFFDDKKDFSQGSSLSLTQGLIIDINSELDISQFNLNPGFHTAYVRLKDTEGSWGNYKSQMIYLPKERKQVNIDKAEYFYNQIVATGAGTSIELSGGENGMVNVEGLQLDTPEKSGFNRLFVRFGDSDGDWGIPQAARLYMPKERKTSLVTEVEYFVDSKTIPGEGFVTELNASASFSTDIEIRVENLKTGFSNLYVRLKDSDGVWGAYYKNLSYLPKSRSDSSKITGLEYFIDTKTVLGDGTQVSIEATNSMSESIEIPVENLNVGFSKVYVRLKDQKDNWGNYTSLLTYVNTGRAEKAKIKDIEYFLSGSSRPNQGSGTSLTAESSSGVFDSVSVDAKALITLTQGLGEHAVYVRAQDTDDVWGIPYPSFVSITNQRMIQGVLSQNGTVLEYKEVSLYLDGTFVKKDTTLDYGLYSFTDVSAGSYEVRLDTDSDISLGREISSYGSTGSFSVSETTNQLAYKDITVIAPLHVNAVTPTNYDSRIRLNNPIELSFNGKFKPSTISNEDVSLISDWRGNLPFNVSKQSNDSVITITPSIQYLPGEKITVYLATAYEAADGRQVLPFTTHFRSQVSNGGTTFADPVDMLIPRDNQYPPVSKSLLVADMDKDGDLDLLHYSTHNYTDTLLIYYNNGDGVFNDIQKKKLITQLKENFETQYFNSYIFIGDYDRDGDIDVGVYHYDQSTSSSNGSFTVYKVQLYLYKNNGTGTLTLDGKFEVDRASVVENTKFVYDNYSGKPSIFVPASRYDENALLLGIEGDAEFTETKLPLNVSSRYFVNFDAKDITGDGLLDQIPVTYNLNSQTFFVGDQNAPADLFVNERSYQRVNDVYHHIFEDFNRNNRLDIVTLGIGNTASFSSDERNAEYMGTRSNFSLSSFGTINGYSVGDLSNNGRLELVVARGNRIDTYSYNASNGLMASQGEIANFTSGYHSFPSLADLDGDGDLDLVYKTEYGNLSRIHVRINSSVSTNNKPTVANTITDKDYRLDEGVQSISIESVFSDEDSDPLIYTVQSSKTSVVTAELTGTDLALTPVSIGNSTITLSADDDKGGVVTTEFIIYINSPDNYTPRLASPISAQELRIGDDSVNVSLTTVFTDPDEGDVLTYSVENPNSSVALATISGTTLTIKAVSVGSVTITVIANDGKASAENDVLVTILPRENRAPVLSSAISNVSINLGDAALEIDPTQHFTDPDTDELIYSIETNNTNIANGSYNSTSKKILVTAAGAGSTTLTVTAKDPGNKEVQTSFNVSVNAKPRQIATLPKIFLIVGGQSASFQLNELFIDDNGETMTYEVSTANSSIASAAINSSGGNRIVSFTPLSEGQTTASLKAKDATTESEVITVEISIKLEDFATQSSSDGDSFYTDGITVKNWCLFSVPGTGVNTTPSTLFNGAVGTDYRLFVLTSSGEYSDQSNEAGSVLSPGSSAWFKTLALDQAFTLQTPAGKRIKEREYAINFSQWRFISNPYEVDAFWYSSDSNQLIWKFSPNSQAWSAVASNEKLKPWTGYLVYNPGSASIFITPDKTQSTASALKTEAASQEEILTTIDAQISVGNQTLRISNNSLSKDVFDKFDRPLLPGTPDQKVQSAYIKNSMVALSDDFRPNRETVEEQVLDYRTIVVPKGNEFITWTNLSSNEDHVLALVNDETYRILAPGDSMKIFQNGKEREFKAYIGTKEQIEANVLPESPLLFDNYPNPFNPTSTIRFALNKAGNVKLLVFDVLGRKVSTLVNSSMQQGYHTVQFNGIGLSSGVYLYRLQVNDQVVSVKKMTLIK